MDIVHIARLLRPFAELSPELLRQTAEYVELLLKWNSKVNLTAVRQQEEIITRHFGESFFVAKELFPQPWRGAVIDVGSGAGFPGLALAMFVGNAEVTLIEADGKKAAFLNEVIRVLALKNAKVFSRRAETCTAKAEVVTMRAVEKFDRILPVASTLVGERGRIALMIGASQVERAESLASDMQWNVPCAIPAGRSRVLLVGTKLVEEPSR